MLVRRVVGAVALATLLTLAAAAPASAHAELVGTDPAEGAVLTEAPEVVQLSFSEPVRGVPDGVEVFDADGEPIASSSRTRDAQLLVTIDTEVGEGSIVVAWRVVSADGHPISGTLTFAVGAPSPTIRAPTAAGAGDDVPLALNASRWPAYAGLLMGVGLVWFAALLLPVGLDKHARVGRRLRLTARCGAAVGAAGWAAGVPLTAVYLRGGGSLLEGGTWQVLPVQELVITALTVLALLAAAWLLPDHPGRTTRHQLAALAGLLALAPLPLSGHTRAEEAAELVVTVDWLHLVAGALWLGGLVGLALTLPALAGRRDAATVVSRFSTAAATALALLVLSGAFLAWRVVGSWSGLVDTGYGHILLVKLALVAAATAIAAYNRSRLLVGVRDAAGFHDRDAVGRKLTRTASVEAVALVGVLLATGFLVQKNPPSEDLAVPTVAAPTARAELGDLDAFVTVSPATVGLNTVTLRLRDADEPAEGREPPRLRISSGNLGGDVPLARTGPGTFEGRVLIPRDGVWQVQVSLRLTEFESPVASLDVRVDGA
jgi:copper transport protein